MRIHGVERVLDVIEGGLVEPSTVDARWEAAFATNWSDVFRFALAWTNDWRDAEDIAQESFLRLWNNRARIDWTRPILPWLLRTTRNLVTDRFRRLRRVVAGPGSIVSTDPTSQQTWLELREDLRRLTRNERTALMTTAVIGLSYAEAGALIGISEGAARAAVSRARQKLDTPT